MLRKALYVIGMMFLLVLSVYLIYIKYYKKNVNNDTLPMPSANVLEVKYASVDMIYDFPSKTVSSKIADIRPQVDGIIVKKFFTDGSMVKKGDKLYHIDQAAHIIIPAPISGYISRSYVTEGTLASKNQIAPLARITQIDPVYVDIPIPSNQFAELGKYKNLSVLLLIDGSEYEHGGTIKSKEVLVDGATDSIIIRAEFPNPEGNLLIGTFVTARLVIRLDNSITLPQQSVSIATNGITSVLTVDENGIVHKKDVTIYNVTGNRWGIAEGLNEGEKVIYEGIHKFRDGLKVNPQVTEDK